MSTWKQTWGMVLMMCGFVAIVIQNEILALVTIAQAIIWHGWEQRE